MKERSISVASSHAVHITGANSVYSYIPKNACTTMRYAISANNLGARAVPMDRVHQTIQNSVASKQQIRDATYRFTILRCPWERLASLFLDKFVEGKRTGRAIRINADKSQYSWPRSTFQRALYRAGLRPYIDPRIFSFREFVSLISEPRALAIDHHWTPQAEFDLCREGYPYSEIFGFHELSSAFKRIEVKTGLKIIDTRSMTGHGTEKLSKVSSGTFADLSLDALKAMKDEGEVPDYKNLYDDETASRVRRMYTEDIDWIRSCFGDVMFTFK